MTHKHSDYQTLMRQRGFRVTPQRQLILDAICESGGHTTPEEIFTRVHSKAPTMSRATVYRTVDFLRELRLIAAIQIEGQTLYEIVGDSPHHHLVCRACGSMQAVDNTLLATLARSVQKKHGFNLDADHLAFVGLCRVCARALEHGPGHPDQ